MPVQKWTTVAVFRAEKPWKTNSKGAIYAALEITRLSGAKVFRAPANQQSFVPVSYTPGSLTGDFSEKPIQLESSDFVQFSPLLHIPDPAVVDYIQLFQQAALYVLQSSKSGRQFATIGDAVAREQVK